MNKTQEDALLQRMNEGLRKVQMDIKDLENRFKFHPATGSETPTNTAKQHEDIRNKCLDMAMFLFGRIPEGREKSLAITHLEEVMMWANAGIARHG